MRYKVAIVGAGPGGAVLARNLARRGIEVVIYEKGTYDTLGHDWSDAVERVALRAAGLEMPVLEGSEWKGRLVKDNPDGEGVFERHAFPQLKIFSPDYTSVKEIDFLMITTDRRKLGQLLIEEAENAGAEIKYSHEGLGLVYKETGIDGPSGVEVQGVKVRNLKTGEEEEVKADVVVESSGFQSILRTSLPLHTGLAYHFNEEDFGFVNREVRRRDPEMAKKDIVPDHYRYGFHMGYQWSHVHSEERIDVGAGVKNIPQNPDPKDLIEEFISRHPSISDQKIRGGRGACIVGPPLSNFVANGFLIIGDAASTSVPTTGCGAGSAMLVGLWASEVLAEAAEENRNDIEKLWDINKKFYLDNERGASFAALAALRTVLQNIGHEDLGFLFRQEIMDARTLENSINGIFAPPEIETKIKSLLRGVSKPLILTKLDQAISKGQKIHKHYRNYPPCWDPKEFAKWKAEADKLMSF